MKYIIKIIVHLLVLIEYANQIIKHGMNNMKFTHNPLTDDAFVEKNVVRNH